MKCDVCGEPTIKMIYMAMPGWLCLNDGAGATVGGLGGWLAEKLPIVVDGPNGDPQFAFFTYEGAYWTALWRWLRV